VKKSAAVKVEMRAAEIVSAAVCGVVPRYYEGIPGKKLREGVGWTAREMGFDDRWCCADPDLLAGWLAREIIGGV
jgi:hypothetical protein